MVCCKKITALVGKCLGFSYDPTLMRFGNLGKLFPFEFISFCLCGGDNGLICLALGGLLELTFMKADTE